MEQPYDTALKLLVALAIGLLIGIERGWSGREETEGSRIAGIRTFSLIGLLGSVLALLSREINGWFLSIGFVSVSLLIIAAHMLSVRRSQDVGATTAFAMMLTFALAAWATLGHPIPAVVVTVIVMSLLGYKPLLHTWLSRIKPQDFYSGVKLLIISLVLLPLLPNQGYGPWQALNPYWIWWMVVLISGLSFLGYLAMELIGKRKGTLVTAVAGALVSSTAVTVSLARFARQHAHAAVFAGGVVLASSIMFVRVVIEVLVVHPGLLHPLWIPLAAMLAGLLCGVAWLWRDQGSDTDEPSQGIEVKNPLQLGMALQFSFLLAVVLLLSEAMQEWFGPQGVYALAVASGLMDVDAITLSLARSATKDLSG
ncbi:MAG: MgtC/SapB family protein, partial [Desulfohalobiaceae bacterium]